MLKDLTRKTRFEGKEKDFSISKDVRELGNKNLFSLLASELVDELNDQLIIITRNEEEITRFSKQDYDNENVDLTLKQLNMNVKEYKIFEEYFTTYSYVKKDVDGNLKDYKVASSNLISKSIEIVLD